MLTFYDPYTTVHDVTADPSDPRAEGAEMTRALDDFGVFPGTCLYCKGQMAYDPRDYAGAHDRLAQFQRMKLLDLTHHAVVQADALSPCDLRDFSEEELLALGVIYMPPSKYIHDIISENFVSSALLTNKLLGYGSRGGARGSEVLIRPGEVLSPFTHAMRASGWQPEDGRGLEQCLEAVKGIVDWDRNRYVHFAGDGGSRYPFFVKIFPPSATSSYLSFSVPTWATFLVRESGGHDRALRYRNLFRALNMPAARHRWEVSFNSSIDDADLQAFLIPDYNNRRASVHGVFLPAFDLYIHRNFGFAAIEFNANLEDHVFERIPERCKLQRTGVPFIYFEKHHLNYVCSETVDSEADPASMSTGTPTPVPPPIKIGVILDPWNLDPDLVAIIARMTWIADGITEDEARNLNLVLRWTSWIDPGLRRLIISSKWVADGVTWGEVGNIQGLSNLAAEDLESARQIVNMGYKSYIQELGLNPLSYRWLRDDETSTERGFILSLALIAREGEELSRQILGYSWTADYITELEQALTNSLAMIASGHPQLIRQMLGYSWLADDMDDREMNAISSLVIIYHADPELAGLVIDYPWIADGIVEQEVELLYELLRLVEEDSESARQVIIDWRSKPSRS